MNKEKSKAIISTLKEIIPNPVCELVYHNTFELLCAVMISSQTTDKRVNQVTPALFAAYPNAEMLALANYDDVYNIIKSLGFARNKALNLIAMSKKLVKDYNGVVPNTLKELETLNGVGHKTASVVLAVGYQIPAMPVDTHLERLSKRLGYIKTGGVAEAEEAYKRYIPKEDWILAHHLLLLFGRYYCKAVKPQCQGCRLVQFCVENKVKS